MTMAHDAALEAIRGGAYSGLSDDAIAQRVLDGEVELFELLMRRHNQKVYRAVRSLLSDEDDVEDAMQQAYVAAYLNLGKREGRSSLSTWLTRIAINEGLQRLRKTKRFVSWEAQQEEDSPVAAEIKRGPRGAAKATSDASPEENAARGELAGLLQRAVESLPELYRAVFVLREVEGLSTEEAADALSTSEDVVKTRLHRAKKMLQERVLAMTQAPVEELYPFPAVRCDRVVKNVMARVMERLFAT